MEVKDNGEIGFLTPEDKLPHDIRDDIEDADNNCDIDSLILEVDSLTDAQKLMQRLHEATVDIHEEHELKELIEKLKQVIPKLSSDARIMQLENEQLLKQNDESDNDMMTSSQVERKLNNMIRESQIGLDEHSFMQEEIDDLNKENSELLQQLEDARKQNQTRINPSLHSTCNEDVSRLMKTIERYHCNVLGLEAVIEGLKRKGVEVPTIPKIERKNSDTQKNYDLSNRGGTDDEKEKRQKEIEILRLQKEAAMDKVQDMHVKMNQMKRMLVRTQNERESLALVEEENLDLMQERKREREEKSSSKSSYLQMVMFVAFIVGVFHQKKPKLAFRKTYM